MSQLEGKLRLTGTCGGCGGQLIQHRRKPHVWVCKNWWKFWKKHAKLQVAIEEATGQPPQ
jgi:hypothetical protein